MSALFCHDHRFVLAEDGRVYSSGQYDRGTVERYEQVFGPLTIAGRFRALEPDEDVSELSLVFPTSERFIGLPNLSSLKGLFLGSRQVEARLLLAVRAADHVIVRLPSEIGMIANRLAKAENKPVLVQAVACVSDGLRHHSSWKARAYAPIAYRRMQRAVWDATFVQYVTQDFLQGRYPTRGASVGVSNVELMVPGPEVLRRRLEGIDATPGAQAFGMVAALFHKEKGVDVTIRALAEARRQDASLRLKVLGPGDKTPWVQCAEENGVAEHVEFCGAAPKGEAVLRWVDNIDVYVQASFQEGLPRALIEALSRGAPALASAAGGTGELLPPEWLHRPGDHTRLAEQMLAIRPAALRRQLAIQNSARSAEYAADVLDQRRSGFWRSFVKSAA